MFYFNSLRVQYSNWPALQCIQFATVLANKGKGLRGQLRFGGISDQLCKCWLLNTQDFNLISQIMSWQSASLSWKVSQKMCALMDLDLKAMTCFLGRREGYYFNHLLFILTVPGLLLWMTRFSSRKLWKSLERYTFSKLNRISFISSYSAVGRWYEAYCGFPNAGHGYTGNFRGGANLFGRSHSDYGLFSLPVERQLTKRWRTFKEILPNSCTGL